MLAIIFLTAFVVGFMAWESILYVRVSRELKQVLARVEELERCAERDALLRAVEARTRVLPRSFGVSDLH